MSRSCGVFAVVFTAILMCFLAAAVQAQPYEGNITLTFTNADVSEVLSAVSAITSQNIVVAGSANTKITVRLSNATMDEALRTVSSLAGLSYKQIGGTYVVAAPEELKKLAFQSGYVDTYAPTGLSLDEAKKMIEASYPFVTVQLYQDRNLISLTGVVDDVKRALVFLDRVDSPAAEPKMVTEIITPANMGLQALESAIESSIPSVKVEQKGASLILTGPSRDIAKAKAFAQSLDIPAAKNYVSKVYTTQYISAEAAAAMLTKALPQVIAVPGPSYYAPKQADFQPLSTESKSVFSLGGSSSYSSSNNNDEEEVKQTRTKTLILSGTQEAIDQAMSILAATDIAPEQVMIEAKVVDISPEYTKELGVKWSWGDFTFIEQNEATPRTVPEDDYLHPASIGDFGRLPWDFTAKLQAMVTNKRAKLLASPKIAVLDSEDANIFIGDLLRYTILRQVNPITGNIYDVETVPVGIALLVRPRVNTDGMITMKIHPVVSIVTGYVNEIPQTSSREADSTIRIKSGETIVIGGLLREEEIKTLTRVPGLSSIPVFGELFKHRNVSKKQSEVVIFITPRLMKSEGQ